MNVSTIVRKKMVREREAEGSAAFISVNDILNTLV